MRDDLSKEELIDALRELDDRIGFLDLPNIQIRAVGGFALVLRDLRVGGVTRDIDTITPDYPSEINEAIQQVALRKNLESNWINNQAVMSTYGDVSCDDVNVHDGMLNAKYDDFDLGFSHIQVKVADLNTLARTKLFAVAAIPLGDRTTKDAKDLQDILTALGYKNITDACRHLEWLQDPIYADGIETMKRFESGEKIKPERYNLDDMIRDIYSRYDVDFPSHNPFDDWNR